MSDDLSTDQEEEEPVMVAPPPRTPRTPRSQAEPSSSVEGTPEKGKLVRKKTSRKKVRRKGTARRSRSSSIVEGDAQAVAVAQVPVTPEDVLKLSVSKHTACVCPTCKKECRDSNELTQHLETHTEAPFPGVKVRHRNSFIKTGNGSIIGSAKATPIVVEAIKLPSVLSYYEESYFNWVSWVKQPLS